MDTKGSRIEPKLKFHIPSSTMNTSSYLIQSYPLPFCQQTSACYQSLGSETPPTTMNPNPKPLHVAFLPFQAAGHMIPILDIAKLFAARHIKTTIITTPLNAPIFLKPLQTHQNPNQPSIDIEIIPFPSSEAGLPEGVESFEHCLTLKDMNRFLVGCQKLEQQTSQVLEKLKPDCLVADQLFAFATHVAAKFNIPRLVFHGTSVFTQCATYSFWKYMPQLSSPPEEEEFVIPHLPHVVKLKKTEQPQDVIEEFMEVLPKALEAEAKSYGVIVNSFKELELEYVEHYRDVVGRMAWYLGPVSLCNREIEAKFQRGKKSDVDEHECLKWLDSKNPGSVVYICFGSLAVFTTSQLGEIVKALEALEQDFLWVVGKIHDKGKNEEWLPNGFEERMKSRGMIIRGWAPQILILGHKSVGAFVTHCGWNSTLEAISSGVPMVTWPVFAEQYINDRYITDILKIGVPVGAKQWNVVVDDAVKWESIKEAITRVMVGEEALELRNRANEFKDKARKAVEEGGSSYSDLTSLIQELNAYIS